MTAPRTVIIILAAGSSSRFGTHKGLVVAGGMTLLERVVKTGVSLKTSPVLLVLGAESSALRQAIVNLPVTIIENKSYASGRTGSPKCALQTLGEDLSSYSVMVFPVDCPFVPTEVLTALITRHSLEPNSPAQSYWIAPEHNGKHGHPVLISGSILTEILALSDDFPLRDFLHRAVTDGRLQQITVPVATPTVLDNVNTASELEAVIMREGLL